MTDTTFRTLSPTEKAETSPRPVVTDKSTPQISKVEVPYLDYETEHSHPYMVDYFQLGPRWRDEMGGFASEVSTIESYFQDQISKGDMPNSIQAVKSAIQKMEKITNVPKEERTVMKVETLSHYIEFLMKCDKTRYNLHKYANTK